MSHIVQPVTQKWLTNVAIVQYIVNDQRFEVACYSSKVASYRNGVEKDINEVIQAHAIFSDAVKGELQSAGALQKAFGTQNTLSICNQIILNGRVQFSELERTTEQDRKFTEIASIVALRLTNSVTGAAYPRALIESAMRNDLHYRVTQQPASAQAAHVIRQLEEFLGVQLPQKVSISVELPLDHAKKCITVCATQYALVIDPESLILDEQSCFFTAVVEVYQYKFVCKSLKELSRGLAHVSLKGTSSLKTRYTK